MVMFSHGALKSVIVDIPYSYSVHPTSTPFSGLPNDPMTKGPEAMQYTQVFTRLMKLQTEAAALRSCTHNNPRCTFDVNFVVSITCYSRHEPVS